ncbi:MAG: aryl-sulfate sulfotransferase [Bacteroidetes bacterium]|nr:aryl-sulfate sulfotransferase [Bacteroidota bacterium]
MTIDKRDGAAQMRFYTTFSCKKPSSRSYAAMIFITTLFLIVPIGLFARTQLPNGVDYVSPVPGSAMNSQRSTIIIHMESPVSSGMFVFGVNGSLSGEHSGQIIIAENGKTVIFKPALPFASGEEVIVTLKSKLDSESGDSVSTWTFGFGVSSVSPAEQRELAGVGTGLFGTLSAKHPMQTAAMSDGWRSTAVDSLPRGFPLPIVVKFTAPTNKPIFLATWNGVVTRVGVASDSEGVDYLMIADNAGKVLYYNKTPSEDWDFTKLSNGDLYYYSTFVGGFLEMDSNYDVIDTFKAENGYTTNPHGIQLMPNGDVLIMCAYREYMDMSQIVPGGNTHALVIGQVIQEIDKNKNVVFQWRTFDHFKITDAVDVDLTAPTVDYVHANALAIDSDGNILLSSCHMDEITKIDRNTSNIIWRWGGKNNQFTFVNDTLQFSYQHSLSRTPSGTFTIFDNGVHHNPPFSRAVEYSLNEQTKTSTLVWQFRKSPDAYTPSMGSVERLPNGNTFVGWGLNPSVAATEVTPDDSVVYEIDLPDSLISYRALRFPWPPSTATSVASDGNMVPSLFRLFQNYPNPFIPTTVISYQLSAVSNVTLKVYDILGREVATLVNGQENAGVYKVNFNASRYAGGVYFYRLVADGSKGDRFVSIKKMLELK